MCRIAHFRSVRGERNTEDRCSIASGEILPLCTLLPGAALNAPYPGYRFIAICDPVDTVNACNSFHHCHLLRLPDDRHNNDSDIPRCRFIRHAFLRYQQLML